MVTINGGGGSGAKAAATVLNGSVVNLTVIATGSCFIASPTISIAAPPQLSKRSTGNALVVNGFVV
ncbi:MAG: hypothetical protein EXS36_01840 [Pedosphaera sp.]|nr:hypothetical protein [Pedosphaera sp.]